MVEGLFFARLTAGGSCAAHPVLGKEALRAVLAEDNR